MATIELMARVKKVLSSANMYNGTGTINVSDVDDLNEKNSVDPLGWIDEIEMFDAFLN